MLANKKAVDDDSDDEEEIEKEVAKKKRVIEESEDLRASTEVFPDDDYDGPSARVPQKVTKPFKIVEETITPKNLIFMGKTKDLAKLKKPLN